mmetsp:Transcript_11801/g.32513  ORF Transcript_11801/g.32513 Transcript_11801/m.32513 type:complete len:154 (-) Transcript_11801:387-848(-)
MFHSACSNFGRRLASRQLSVAPRVVTASYSTQTSAAASAPVASSFAMEQLAERIQTVWNANDTNNHDMKTSPMQALDRRPFDDALLKFRTIGTDVINNNAPIMNSNDNTAGVLQMMNRNARPAKRANKGKRPCSNVARRAKKSRFGKRKRPTK